jgi:hypothetical protein
VLFGNVVSFEKGNRSLAELVQVHNHGPGSREDVVILLLGVCPPDPPA